MVGLYQASSGALGIKEVKRTEDKIQKILEAGNNGFKTSTDTTRNARQEKKERRHMVYDRI